MPIPIIIIALILLLGGGFTFWSFIPAMSAIVQILSVVIVIIIAPFLVKLISDLILYNKLGISKNVSLIIGVIASIPILLILYLNVWALIIFGIAIGVIYVIVGYMVGSISPMRWFKTPEKYYPERGRGR